MDCEENQPKLPEDPTSFEIGARRTASVETLLPHKLMWKIKTAKVGQVVSAQDVSSAFPTCTCSLNFSARHLFCLRKFVSSIMSKEKDCREYATIHFSTVKQPSIWHLFQPSAQKRVAGIVVLGHLSLTAGAVKITSCQGCADLLANSYKLRDYTITVHLLAITLTSLLVLPSSFHLNLSVLSRSQGSCHTLQQLPGSLHRPSEMLSTLIGPNSHFSGFLGTYIIFSYQIQKMVTLNSHQKQAAAFEGHFQDLYILLFC